MTLPSIHDQARTGVFITRDGKRWEYPIRENPHKYLPVFLAIDGWLQEFPLDSVIDAWWLAQKKRQDKLHEARPARRSAGGEVDVIEINRAKSSYIYRINPLQPREIDRRLNRHGARWERYNTYSTEKEARARLWQLERHEEGEDE